LDLLLYGQEIVHHPRLLLPHPGCWYRRFVLDPLAEIAPDVVHPIKQAAIGELRERLLHRPLSVGLAGGLLEDRRQNAADLSATFPQALVMPWSVGEIAPMLLLWLGMPAEQDVTFEDLPSLPRLDLTGFRDPPQTAAHDVVNAAFGS
jgi:2-amino-4-hydroxy-6-hydroxymethyldihydropteridine diphosphokinase